MTPQIATNVSVVQTYAVAKGRAPVSHYEIHLASEDAPGRHHSGRCDCLITVTQDEKLYARALDAECEMTRRFDVTWHTVRRLDGRLSQLLDALTERCAQTPARVLCANG